MVNIRKRIKCDDVSEGGGRYNAIHNKHVYEFDHPYGTTKQLTANITSENMLSKLDSEGHHCQVLSEVTDQRRDDSRIKNVNGFIKSSDDKLN